MQQVFVAGANWLKDLQIFFAAVFGYIKEWQFQIAILLILLSGVIFIKAIGRQIKLQEFKSEDRRQRLGRVYGASMPVDLEAICSYAIRSSQFMRDQGRMRCPILPAHVLENLKGLVENLDDDDAEPIAELVVCYHTQHAGLRVLWKTSTKQTWKKLRVPNLSISTPCSKIH